MSNIIHPPSTSRCPLIHHLLLQKGTNSLDPLKRKHHKVLTRKSPWIIIIHRSALSPLKPQEYFRRDPQMNFQLSIFSRNYSAPHRAHREEHLSEQSTHETDSQTKAPPRPAKGFIFPVFAERLSHTPKELCSSLAPLD